MIFRFVMVSDEAPDFLREIRIDGTASFKELHDAIIDACGYSGSELSSFFISDRQWRPHQEVLLEDMGLRATDEDYYLMRDTYLDSFLEDEGDRLLFQFDQLGDRYFYIELKEIILGEHLKAPVCSRKKGTPPRQTSDVEELLISPATPKAKLITSSPAEPDYSAEDELYLDDTDTEGLDIIDSDNL